MQEDNENSPAIKSRSEEPDTRSSLKHILATDASEENPPTDVLSSKIDQVSLNQDESSFGDTQTPPTKAEADVPMYTATTTTTRRNANGSVSSVYSGNKIRHLKKDDGIPLWRKDIQYDFLRMVFEDDKPVFHKISDGSGGHTFCDIYLDAMAKSSKCSKILKDKLLTERSQAINMAMVCLLVNVGRMNTTLNFFPEMRAQLRTYHSIPSLQANQDPNAYKQLQDAPRLKSILKGATEDTDQPSTIEEIKLKEVPRTNPVNLIFVLAQYAPKISEIHFYPPRHFFDLVMRNALSSRSRATVFLWLMWWYLESDFSKDDALKNPFGAGQDGSDGDQTKGMPVKCPMFKHLSEEEVEQENVDTAEEIKFGHEMEGVRKNILASDMAPVVTGPKRTSKKGFNNNPVFSVVEGEGSAAPGRDHSSGQGRSGSRLRLHPHHKGAAKEYASDTDRTRSTSPPNLKPTANMQITTLLNDENQVTPSSGSRRGQGRGNWARNRADGSKASFKAKADYSGPHETASPGPSGASVAGPHGFYLPLNGSDPSHKRSRPLTAHQAAVEKYRKQRVDYILDRRLRKQYRIARRHRRRDGAMARAWLRCKMMPDGYDTDEELMVYNSATEPEGSEAPAPRFVGLLPAAMEPNDWGEEAHARAQVMRRAGRRLERWEVGALPTRRKHRVKEDSGQMEADSQANVKVGFSASMIDDDIVDAEEELDDVDRELLGEMDGDESDAMDEDEQGLIS